AGRTAHPPPGGWRAAARRSRTPPRPKQKNPFAPAATSASRWHGWRRTPRPSAAQALSDIRSAKHGVHVVFPALRPLDPLVGLAPAKWAGSHAGVPPPGARAGGPAPALTASADRAGRWMGKDNRRGQYRGP